MLGRLFLASHSIRGRLIVGVVVLHAVLMGLVVFDMFGRQQAFMTNLLADKGQAMAEAMALNATSWLLSNDLTGLDELTDSMTREADLAFALILDRNGKVRASSDPTLFNLTLSDANSVGLLHDLEHGEQTRSAHRYHDGLVDCLVAVTASNRRIGYARVALSSTALEAELRAMVRKGAEYTAVAIISGGLLAWLLVRTMMLRLARLSRTADAITAGSRSVALLDETGQDEVARLTRDFNGMVRALERDRIRQSGLMRQLDRANADLTRLADVSAHHLQEPVRRLILFSQSLRSQVQTPEGDTGLFDSLGQIERDGRYLRELLRDIQAYLAAGHVDPLTDFADAGAAADQACHKLRQQIQAAAAEIVIDQLPPAAIAKNRLVEVFHILIDNAVKFHRPVGTPLVRISAETEAAVVRYRVTDNGIGIPATYHERVFQIFERMHPQSRYPGTGIGLAIIRRIVEAYHGRIWLEDAPEGGTVAVVELPKEYSDFEATSPHLLL